MSHVFRTNMLEEGMIVADAIRETMASARKIVDSVRLDSKFTYRLTDYKLHKEPSAHAVRVAVFAAAVAKKYNENLDDMVLPTE